MTVWAALFTLLTFYAIGENRELARQNQQRIADIQDARASSCRQTYEGIWEVFTPLFPPPPRTTRQQRTLDTFNGTVDDLKANCGRQTQTQKEEP